MSGGEALHFEPASFRDRDARVLVRGDVVFRALGREGLAAWRALAGSTAFRTLVDEGRLIATDEVDPADAECPEPTLRAGLLRHQRVPFVSYPYEWSFSMLKDAALLHLDLIDRLLDDGLITKDATPYNVQWVGSSPVFVDVGSIRPLRPGEAWPGYRQFCRLFLYPLLLQARLGMPWQPWLRGAAEGIDAATCRKLLGTRAMLRPSLLAHVHLHAKAEARYAATDREVARELQEAGFDSRFIRRNINSLRRLIVSLAWEPERAGWAAYAPPEIYGSDDDGRKHAFVRDAVRARPRRHVWDLGANTGSYAAIAAPHAAGVVAFDSDEGVIELLYRQLRSRDDRVVVPLRVDLADPSPRGGWRQAEHRAIEDRGQPDLVLCLALLHHLVITAGVPLAAVVEWLASLGADLVVEFVTREDPMAQRLLRQRGGSCDDYDLRAFEDAVAARFARVANVSLAGGRRELFHLAHRQAVT